MATVVGIGSSSQKYQGVFVLNQLRVPQVSQSWASENALFEVLSSPPNTSKTPVASIAAGETFWRRLVLGLSVATAGYDLFQGDYNPQTNAPALAAGAGTKGEYYKLAVSSAPPVTTNSTTATTSSTAVSVVSGVGIALRMRVSGANIPAGVTVGAIVGNDLTLSTPLSILANTALTFETFAVGLTGFVAGAEIFYTGAAWVQRAVGGGVLLAATGQSATEGMTQKAISDELVLRAAQAALDTANGKITVLQGAIKVGTNVGNGSQAPVSLGGFQINVTGLESGSVGGGAITISGPDSGAVAGSVINIAGTNSGTVGGSQNALSGNRSGMIGGFQNANRAEYATVLGGFALTLPVGADYSAIIGGRSFTAPAVTDTLFVPQLYLFVNGGGVSLVSPDGLQRRSLTIDNAGGLLLGATAASAGTSAGSADTFAALTYAASIALDFNAATVQTLAATGNVAFAASLNVALLKTKELYLTNTTGAAITISCPTGWTFFPGPAPTTLAAGKQAVLTLRALGTTDSTVKAAYVAQA